MQSTRIFVISWNTQSIRLSESMIPDVVQGHRNADYTTWRYDANIPDFWPPLLEKILEVNPMILICGFQEDVRPGSYFHSHLLPEELPEHGYQLYDRTTSMGVGQTSLDGLSEGDPYVRGLRLSIYVHREAEFPLNCQWKSLTYSPYIFRNKAAAAIYVTLPNRETLAVVNMHLPFNAQSLIDSVVKRDQMIRQDAVLQQDQFFNEAYRKLVLEAPSHPEHAIILGDLNYRMDPFQNWSAEKTGSAILNALYDKEKFFELIEKHDQLRQQLNKRNIYPLQEGIQNEGPYFPPTGKLKKNRTPGEISIDSYSLGKFDQRVPSFPDRILYTSNIKCIEYTRYEHGIISKSDHAAVVGVFSF